MSDTPQTIPEALARSERGGVTFLMHEERRLSYGELLRLGRKVAGGLREAGIERGERLLVVLPTSLDLIAVFFGCNLAGVVPCLVSPPEGFGSGQTFRRRIGELAELVGATGFVAEPDLEAALGEGAPGLPLLDPVALRASAEAAPIEVGPDDTAFIQFTSGTTRLPKGVVISQRAVSENTRQIGVATDMRPGSVVVSWLPMFHDMGLVSWLTSLFNDVDAVLSTPMAFLRRPASWLKSISRFKGSHCPAPTFAFRYLVDRVKERQLDGVDLSSWKTAYVGAEPIPPAVLAAFQGRFAPLGLPPTTLLPCYGMAEATLALTFSPQREVFRTAAVSRAGLGSGRVREPQGTGDALELVSCGRPLPGVEVVILDEAGEELGEGRVGELAARGPSLFSGYWGQPRREPGERFLTGDVGFWSDGEVYVTGRKKDVIILRGENHHPAEIEWVAGRVPGVRMGRSCAFGLTDEALGSERLCLVVEAERKAFRDPEALERLVRRRVHEESGLTVDVLDVVEPGEIPVTTSGKVRRSAVRTAFLARRGDA